MPDVGGTKCVSSDTAPVGVTSVVVLLNPDSAVPSWIEDVGAFGSFTFAMSAAAYAVRVVCGPPVWRISSTLIGVAAVAPSNSVHHSTTRIAGVVVFVASWSIVLMAVPVVMGTAAAAP